MVNPLPLRPNIGVIVALCIQSAGIIWWASSLSFQVAAHNVEIEKIKTQISTNTSVTLTREQLNDILGSRDARLENLSNEVTEFKLETRTILQRIENKL